MFWNLCKINCLIFQVSQSFFFSTRKIFASNLLSLNTHLGFFLLYYVQTPSPLYSGSFFFQRCAMFWNVCKNSLPISFKLRINFQLLADFLTKKMSTIYISSLNGLNFFYTRFRLSILRKIIMNISKQLGNSFSWFFFLESSKTYTQNKFLSISSTSEARMSEATSMLPEQ